MIAQRKGKEEIPLWILFGVNVQNFFAMWIDWKITRIANNIHDLLSQGKSLLKFSILMEIDVYQLLWTLRLQYGLICQIDILKVTEFDDLVKCHNLLARSPCHQFLNVKNNVQSNDITITRKIRDSVWSNFEGNQIEQSINWNFKNRTIDLVSDYKTELKSNQSAQIRSSPILYIKNVVVWPKL